MEDIGIARHIIKTLRSAITIIYNYYYNSVYNKDPIERWIEVCILPFPKNGNISTIVNYRGITLIPISQTEYISLNREPSISVCMNSLKGDAIKNVSDFKYFGSY